MNHNSFIQKRRGLSYIIDGYQSLLATKTFLVMKLIFIFCLAFCMQVSASSSAQKITLVAQNASLERVLKDIERQSGYSFWYKTELMLRSKRYLKSSRDRFLVQMESPSLA
jgi:TonB-dependent starch-binding outer membrane protein SusC